MATGTKRKAECVVPWLDGVDLEACAHKKLKSLAKRAGIAANQSGKALVEALRQHAADPSKSGARSVAKQEAEAAKQAAAAAFAALEVLLPEAEAVELDWAVERGQPIRFLHAQAEPLTMRVGEHSHVASLSSASKMTGVKVDLLPLDDEEADGSEPCAELRYKGPRRRPGVGNAFGKPPSESWTLRALRPGSVGLVVGCTHLGRTSRRRYWHVRVDAA